MLRLLFFCSLCLLSACLGGGHPAPVLERDERAGLRDKRHKVVPGETLFSIAWRYDMDFRELADANNLSSPYTIFPGQVLRFTPAPGTRAGSTGAVSNRGAKDPGGGPAASPKPSASTTPRPRQSSTTNIDRSRFPNRWQWPANGKIARPYAAASALHKGIDIEGKLGEPVRAANSGKVVYAGSGLVGYGKLLIIRHDEVYLSAYGHNSKLLVAEGELVKVGQTIAEFGDSGTDKVMLHFEIRREGKPIDPLKLLPGRAR